MNNIHKLTKLFHFYIIYLINSCKATLKQKSKNTYIKKNSKINFSERNLQETLRKGEELPFHPLAIYIDTAEFNETFPEDLEEYKDSYIIAMNEAKNILRRFFRNKY